MSLKVIATQVELWVELTLISAKRKMTKAAVKQMFSGQLRNGQVVRTDKGKRKICQGPSHVDHWHASPLHGSGHESIVDASQDSIALPTGQPSRGGIAESLWLKERRPLTMFAIVTGNATQQAASVGARCLDQDSHMFHTGHFKVVSK
jgi:hypothetical protein